MDDQAIRNRLVNKLLRNRVVGSHKKQVTTVVNRYLPPSEQGRGKTLLEEMVTNPTAPIEGYGGGHRENVRLSSVEAAVSYLEENDGEVPFGFD